ncbi:MAG: family 43 glycosylhydrolase [Acidobacteria bacterium]|nr:family 43 glycosylhydrolase [Acidobacteriota bacterium]
MTYRPLALALALLLAVPALSQPKPRPVDAPAAIRAGLESHDKALYVKAGWIRDPYILLAPDGFYYLTGTTPLPNDPREQSDPYNVGLRDESIVGWKMQAWRSRDLIDWDSLGTPFSLLDGVWNQLRPEAFAQTPPKDWRLWAPELHFFDGRWALVHTSPRPVRGANLSLTQGAKLEGPWENPLGEKIGVRHDPSLFRDDDGTIWLVYGNTQIVPLKADFSDLAGDPVVVEPANRKIGHEGCLLRKIGGKYVLFGTAWSTDKGRKGSYNLYYCTADKVTGPYGERRFAGRFLGHGTPFQDKQGRWWSTAFFNANVPPLSREAARGADLSADAQTINEQGLTLVPLDVQILPDGDVRIHAKDPDYASPGPDEVQQF